MKKSKFQVLKSLFTSPVVKLGNTKSKEVIFVCDTVTANVHLLCDLFFGHGKPPKMSVFNTKLMLDLFMD
jgi:hypothetical protein